MCKNHQWPRIAYRWKSQVLSLVFRASLVLLHPVFLSSLPGSPLGTLGSCHLEPSIVLTFLWISLFPLTSSLVPILYRAGSYSAFKVLRNIISCGKPLWCFLSSTSCFSGFAWHFVHTSIVCDFVSYLCAPGPSGWRPWNPIDVSHHPVLCLVCSRPLGNKGRMNFSIQHWFLKSF